MLYTVGEMAKRLQVAPSTLRYYDKEGLLPFLERSNGGIRMFRESDFEWLSIIACLKQTGMPIKDIKTFIDWCVEGDATIGQRLGLIDRQRQRVLEQIQQLQETLQVLDYKHWYYEKAREAGSCAIHDSLTEADVPAPHRAACFCVFCVVCLRLAQCQRRRQVASRQLHVWHNLPFPGQT